MNGNIVVRQIALPGLHRVGFNPQSQLPLLRQCQVQLRLDLLLAAFSLSSTRILAAYWRKLWRRR